MQTRAHKVGGRNQSAVRDTVNSQASLWAAQKNFVGISPVEGFGLFAGEVCRDGDLVEEYMHYLEGIVEPCTDLASALGTRANSFHRKKPMLESMWSPSALKSRKVD